MNPNTPAHALCRRIHPCSYSMRAHTHINASKISRIRRISAWVRHKKIEGSCLLKFISWLCGGVYVWVCGNDAVQLPCPGFKPQESGVRGRSTPFLSFRKNKVGTFRPFVCVSNFWVTTFPDVHHHITGSLLRHHESCSVVATTIAASSSSTQYSTVRLHKRQNNEKANWLTWMLLGRQDISCL